MKLYLIYTNVNNRFGAYSRAVVAAENEEDARRTHPDGSSTVLLKTDYMSPWVSLDHVRADYLGEARPDTQPGVILASYIGR